MDSEPAINKFLRSEQVPETEGGVQAAESRSMAPRVGREFCSQELHKVQPGAE